MTKEFETKSSFFSTNIIFINELYQKFLLDPASVDSSWQSFFAQNKDEVTSILSDYNGPSWAKRHIKVIDSEDFDISSLARKEPPKTINAKTQKPSSDTNSNEALLAFKLENLTNSYRRFGHLAANLDPLGLVRPSSVTELDYRSHQISDSDLASEVNFRGSRLKLFDVLNYLKSVYTNTVAAEFEYISDLQKKEWLAENLEQILTSDLNNKEKTKILGELINYQRFEQFLHKRFPGAKRFSIEGGESSISAIEKIIESSVAGYGVKKIVIGMAHRGRLNVLTAVMGKPYHQMISEFQGTPGIPEKFTKSGDVKYHMGYASSRIIDGNKVDLSLAFNPSHLEAVNPVVAGRVRAKQDLFKDEERVSALAVMIHGDAAFIGQGSVAENLVMNSVKGYDTGGVVHIVINNQIGFTANPTDSRATRYASDLAKAIEAPIFHVNGDDVEAVIKLSHLAILYRHTFKKDVVLDVVCYRKYGHNEGDEPLYTQPIMYDKIKSQQNIEKIYADKLIAEGVISREQYDKMVEEFESLLGSEFDKAATYKPQEADWLKGAWSHIKNGEDGEVKTAIDTKIIKKLIDSITFVPSRFTANPKILRQLEARKHAVESEENIDWGTAEAIAFASLLSEGYPVRITGQDSGRGTFSHRHSILHDSINGSRHNIFSTLENAAKYEVHDSVLSEYGVLGFEYGYSLSSPDVLTIWEAQFGDFANGAQIIFDQFIASSEVKWLRKSGLVMLLPHGFEGQGPEHSSARLERCLQACADENLRVVNITNPANFFHALRRQLHSKDRKPLIVMSPKSLLRHKLAVSKLEEFSKGNFKPLIAESKKLANDEKIKRAILCSGKVYYDLLEAREVKKIEDVALLRVEQLYPLPSEEIEKELARYKNADIIWCQEEPKNMGSWSFINELIEVSLTKINHKAGRAKYVGRVASASPATGYASYHAKEQKAVIDEALEVK